MSGRETAEALAQVLADGGDIDLAFDWLEGEARQAYDTVCEVIADPTADPDEHRRALLLRDRLGEAFARLRELANSEEAPHE